LDPAAAEACGYVREDLGQCFGGYLSGLARNWGLDEAATLAELDRWYNGYWWGHGRRVFNPWSILSVLQRQELAPYWMSTGTPTMLVRLLQERQTPPEDFESVRADSALLEAFDVERIELPALLWQTGYLTVLEKTLVEREPQFTLGYPNHEVRTAWYNTLLVEFLNLSNGEPRVLARDLAAALAAGDVDRFAVGLRALYASIPRVLHQPSEAYYHSLFHLTMSLMGACVRSEVPTDKGRVDAILEAPHRVCLLEFKLGTAESALAQIEASKYFESWLGKGKELLLVGVGGFERRQIECRWRRIE